LFSLGILLYAVTTGKHPFRGAHPGETLQNICSTTPATPPSAFMPDYPNELEEVVLKALQKQPDHRYGSAREMLAALHRAFPSALGPSFETEVADYMKQVFGAKASERRAAIRNAQQDTAASSVGTLRAISISQESGQFSLVPTPVPPSSSSPSIHAMPTVPVARAKRFGGVAMAAAALLGLGAIFQLSRGPTTAASATASSPVPKDLVSLEHVMPKPPAPPATPVESLPLAAPAASAAERSTKTSRAARGVVAPKLQPAVTPSVVAATAATPPAATKTETPPAASINAWDRGAFGGRH
jgi:serine/threonine-protein kinase